MFSSFFCAASVVKLYSLYSCMTNISMSLNTCVCILHLFIHKQCLCCVSSSMSPLFSQSDTWQKMLGRMYASPQLPCANVFCKKKQLEHYHCLECGSAFSKVPCQKYRMIEELAGKCLHNCTRKVLGVYVFESCKMSKLNKSKFKW